MIMDPVLTSCKVTAVSNPITFESGLIYLADYSAKRLIKPKKKQQTEQQQQPEADLPSPEIQFTDEFASPFSWFPKNGFTAYKITCEGPRSSCEVEESNTKNEEKSKDEEKKEGSMSNIVKLSDIKKSVLESARQRKLDPVSIEHVKRAPKPVPEVQPVSPSKEVQVKEMQKQSSVVSSPIPKTQAVPVELSSLHSSSVTIPQIQDLKVCNTQIVSTASIENPSTPPQVSQKQFLLKKVSSKAVEEGFQLHKPSSLTNCASVSTLNSEIVEEKVSSNDQLVTGATKEEEGVPLTRGMSDANPSDVTISEEFGTKMGTASSYEFLLDW